MIWKQRNSNQKIISAFFQWLSGMAVGKDAILVDFAGRKEFFYFDFPLRYGDKPNKTNTLPVGREITFIIRTPENRKSIEETKWIKIFSSPEWQIFENRNRCENTFPLRWRLNEEEKKTALRIARDALERFMFNGQRLEQQYFVILSPRFYFKTGLDVAIWAKGQLRGSAVLENFNLGEGIAEAAIRASRDSRFKPLSKEELAVARIEITIIQNPFVPISDRELKQNRIYPDKGYLLSYRDRKGWFLPEIFNVRRFSNLESLLSDLGHEKAGLMKDDYKNSDVFIFEVDDFIESADRSFVLTLWGPITKTDSIIHNSEFITQHLRAAADWLCRIQEPDGNFPPVINPLTGSQTQIDWPRLAFAAWALAEFGKVIRGDKYVQAAEKSFSYLRNYLIPDSRFSISGYELTLAYFGRLSLALGKSKDATLAAEKILVSFDNISFEPILFAQIASFLKVLPDNVREYSQTLENICGILKNTFEKNKRENVSMSLAAWAELMNVFSYTDNEFFIRVGEWLKSQQLPSGAFPESTFSDFVYARGSGKIFEVLTLEPERNKEAIEKVLTWLFSMQYNNENTFFISSENLPKISGGLRHDYFNQEAWIDAVSHLLLGGKRLLNMPNNG